MSQPLIYDALLAHYLAAELGERLAGRRIGAVRFDSEARRLVVEWDRERLVWELHPARGWLGLVDSESAVEGWGGRRIRTARRARVRRVACPPDERILQIEIDAGGPDRACRLVVELMTNQWNVLALDPRGTIVSALWSREAGGRELRTGSAYAPPTASTREGRPEPISPDRFAELIGDTAAADRPGVLLRSVAWTSSLNVPAIVAPELSVGEAYDRYRALASRPPADPRLLEARGGQPYPLPLPGVADRPVPTLIEAFAGLSAREAPAGLPPEVRDALEDRLDRLRGRARSLRREAEAAPARAAELRSRADLLMARLHEVPTGVDRVELEDFEGGSVTVDLDPSLSPAANAEALYDRARKRDRAAERLPARVRETEEERRRLEALLEGLEAGTADPEEVARWVEEVRPATGGREEQATRLPYRSFRSSGGLEIRVGRSARTNDELTFHHSAPDDIWLHARDAQGAHVILRWGDRDQNPPHRDLVEAAVLAAVNSRARTSGTVPVDWTRRKYVRSPRKAPPGAVIPDRISTVFVEPDPDVEKRLAD